MYLIFDTETTGLPKKWNAPISDTDNWPTSISAHKKTRDSPSWRVAGGCYSARYTNSFVDGGGSHNLLGKAPEGTK